MSESNPLAGLTEDEADKAIARLEEKAKLAKDHAKAVEVAVKEAKAARKDLEPPVPLDQRGGPVTEVQAEPAQITIEGGQI